MITTITTDMMRQEFDIGDLVQLVSPYDPCETKNGSIGLVTKSKRIYEHQPGDYRWHRDEYHCLVKIPGGPSEWVRAKFLKIISRAKKIVD